MDHPNYAKMLEAHGAAVMPRAAGQALGDEAMADIARLGGRPRRLFDASDIEGVLRPEKALASGQAAKDVLPVLGNAR